MKPSKSRFRKLALALIVGGYCLTALTSCDEFTGELIGQGNCENIDTLPANDMRQGTYAIGPRKAFIDSAVSTRGTGEDAKRSLAQYRAAPYGEEHPELCCFYPDDKTTTKVEDNKLVTRNADGTVVKTQNLSAGTTTQRGGMMVMTSALTSGGKLVLNSKWQSDPFKIPGFNEDLRLQVTINDKGAVDALLLAELPLNLTVTKLQIFEKSRASHFIVELKNDSPFPHKPTWSIDAWVQEAPDGKYPMRLTVTNPGNPPKTQLIHLMQMKNP